MLGFYQYSIGKLNTDTILSVLEDKSIGTIRYRYFFVSLGSLRTNFIINLSIWLSNQILKKYFEGGIGLCGYVLLSDKYILIYSYMGYKWIIVNCAVLLLTFSVQCASVKKIYRFTQLILNRHKLFEKTKKLFEHLLSHYLYSI